MKLDTKLDREDLRQIGKFVYPNILLIIGAGWCEVTGHPGAALIGFSICLLTSIIYKYLDLRSRKKWRKSIPTGPVPTWYDDWFRENYPESGVEGRPLYKEYAEYLKARNLYYEERKNNKE